MSIFWAVILWSIAGMGSLLILANLIMSALILRDILRERREQEWVDDLAHELVAKNLFKNKE